MVVKTDHTFRILPTRRIRNRRVHLTWLRGCRSWCGEFPAWDRHLHQGRTGSGGEWGFSLSLHSEVSRFDPRAPEFWLPSCELSSGISPSSKVLRFLGVFEGSTPNLLSDGAPSWKSSRDSRSPSIQWKAVAVQAWSLTQSYSIRIFTTGDRCNNKCFLPQTYTQVLLQWFFTVCPGSFACWITQPKVSLFICGSESNAPGVVKVVSSKSPSRVQDSIPFYSHLYNRGSL